MKHIKSSTKRRIKRIADRTIQRTKAPKVKRKPTAYYIAEEVAEKFAKACNKLDHSASEIIELMMKEFIGNK